MRDKRETPDVLSDHSSIVNDPSHVLIRDDTVDSILLATDEYISSHIKSRKTFFALAHTVVKLLPSIFESLNLLHE